MVNSCQPEMIYYPELRSIYMEEHYPCWTILAEIYVPPYYRYRTVLVQKFATKYVEWHKIDRPNAQIHWIQSNDNSQTAFIYINAITHSIATL